MLKKLMAANWKMNKNLSQVDDFFKEFIRKIKDAKDREIVVCVPAVFLQEANKLVAGTQVKLGVQNVHEELKGAYTGETSVLMVKDFAEYVIIGHSERRIYSHETDEMVNKKLKLCLQNGLKAIVCIGENLKERKKGITQQVVKKQLMAALDKIDKIGDLNIAYEPVWSISTFAKGEIATPGQAQEAHSLIRKLLARKFGQKAETIRIIYGGSVTPENVRSLVAQKDIDGVLVGGASLSADSFAEIVMAP